MPFVCVGGCVRACCADQCLRNLAQISTGEQEEFLFSFWRDWLNEQTKFVNWITVRQQSQRRKLRQTMKL